MAPGSTRMSGLRAITAVIALYALVLQAFLGGLMPTMTGADGHVLCLSGMTAVGEPAPEQPLHPHADCCTAAHAAATAVAPREAGATAVRAHRRIAKIAFAAEHAHGPRAPPGSIARPRGPPAV